MPFDPKLNPIIIPAPGPSHLIVARGNEGAIQVVSARLNGDAELISDAPFLSLGCTGLRNGSATKRAGWNDGKSEANQIMLDMGPDGSLLILINMAAPGEPPRFAHTTLEELRGLAQNWPADISIHLEPGQN